MNDKVPVPKVAAAGIAGAVSTLIVWGLTVAGIEVPDGVAGAIVTVCAFVAGYIKR